MGPGAFRAEVGDLQIVLQRKRGGHDFPVDRADGFLRQAAVVHFDEAAEQRFLALGSVDLQAVALFDHAHFVDEIGAAGEQVEQVVVDGVDLAADVVEIHEEMGRFQASVGGFVARSRRRREFRRR